MERSRGNISGKHKSTHGRLGPLLRNDLGLIFLSITKPTASASVQYLLGGLEGNVESQSWDISDVG